MPFQHVLATTDFSEAALPAVRVAHRWATTCGARLSVVHVYAPGHTATGIIPADRAADLERDRERHAEQTLADLAAAELGALAAEHRLVVAHPSPPVAICGTAKARGADLVVVGTHGRTGLARMLMGSVAERVVRGAPCAVLAVRPKFDLDTFPSKVMVCTDMSPASETGVALGGAVARAFGARPTLAHVYDAAWWDQLAEPGTEQRARADIHARLDATREAHFGDTGEAAFLRGDSPAEVICRAAEKQESDLVVLATHGLTGLSRWVIGSVAERVARHAPCPVLIARVAPDKVLDD
jgi:nucleotide-binding universal stress UspA family protein